MTFKLVVCFCNNDFLSEVVIEQILLNGFAVKICSDRPFNSNVLRVVAKLGQISFHVVDMLDYNAVIHAMYGAHYVINFTPLSLSYNINNVKQFSKLMQKSSKNIADASVQLGICKLIHISNIVFDVKNMYSESILEAEKIILSIFKNSIILRFDFIFGENDRLLCKFAKLFSIMSFFPLFGNCKSTVAPVYVGDVALVILKCIISDVNAFANRGTFEISGVNDYSIIELYNLVADYLEKKMKFFKIPFCFFRIQTFFYRLKLFYILTYMVFGRFEPLFNINEYPLFKHNIKARKNNISMFITKPTLLKSKMDSILEPFHKRIVKQD